MTAPPTARPIVEEPALAAAPPPSYLADEDEVFFAGDGSQDGSQDEVEAEENGDLEQVSEVFLKRF